MPYSLTVEPELVRVVFFGVMTAADLHAMANDVTAIERGRPVPHNRLTDLSQVSDVQLTFTDMLGYVAQRQKQWHAYPLRSALVAAMPVALGFAHMFETLSEQAQVQVFATREAAEAWLLGGMNAPDGPSDPANPDHENCDHLSAPNSGPEV